MSLRKQSKIEVLRESVDSFRRESSTSSSDISGVSEVESIASLSSQDDEEHGLRSQKHRESIVSIEEDNEEEELEEEELEDAEDALFGVNEEEEVLDTPAPINPTVKDAKPVEIQSECAPKSKAPLTIGVNEDVESNCVEVPGSPLMELMNSNVSVFDDKPLPFKVGNNLRSSISVSIENGIKDI